MIVLPLLSVREWHQMLKSFHALIAVPVDGTHSWLILYTWLWLKHLFPNYKTSTGKTIHKIISTCMCVYTSYHLADVQPVFFFCCKIQIISTVIRGDSVQTSPLHIYFNLFPSQWTAMALNVKNGMEKHEEKKICVYIFIFWHFNVYI